MKVILFLFSLGLFGSDFDNTSSKLNEFYERGPFLVYDCVVKHWVCTRDLEFNRCKEQKKEALLDFKAKLPCVEFSKYKTEKLCQKEQQRVTNNFFGDRFCMHPEEKLKQRDF